jgi:hypothetical protein
MDGNQTFSAEEGFCFGDALVSFVRYVHDSLTECLGYDKAMVAHEEFAILRHCEFVTYIVETGKLSFLLFVCVSEELIPVTVFNRCHAELENWITGSCISDFSVSDMFRH